MYVSGDPRSTLASSAVEARPAPVDFKGATYARFYAEPPQEQIGESQIWYTRGQNLIVGYIKGRAGMEFRRLAQMDEYVVLVQEKYTPVEVEANGDQVSVDGFSLIVVPPGESTVRLKGDGDIVIFCTTLSTDLVAKCINAEAYTAGDPNVPPFQAWPIPPGGYKLRSYSLDVAPQPGRFGTIFRCTTIMVNFLPGSGPRDIRKMSPHHHDDFEQYSLAVKGSFFHYLRWPWTSDFTMWRRDESEFCGTPSVAVIPPPAIHTSRAMDPGANTLVDVFSPPRIDFSSKPGWVLNEVDYPLT